ncbi:lamin tail domain-containing protein [Candidatus Poribacteria bacterium]|nr:lamin tail domain-containing protein [Candidatus Poribacteria bacterium]
MFFNKLKFILIFPVLLVIGLAFVAIPATAVTPVLSVPDEVANVDTEPDTLGIQVYGIRAESVSFELTITFQVDPTVANPVNTPVTGFEVEDIDLVAADSNDRIVPGGAIASAVQAKANGSVYTTTITANGNVNTVIINVPTAAANTPGEWDSVAGQIRGNAPTVGADQLVVNILRSAAPPLTLSSDRSIPGNAPFTVTLTSSTTITLTRADLKITGGSVDSLSSDAAKRVWTVTIRPGVGIAQITMEPSANGSYIFPKGTFTVDTTGPVATITGTPPVGGGVFPMTITFDEPVQTGSTLVPNEITVIGGSITALFAIPNTNSYVATLAPNPSATSVKVQVNTGAVADAGGVQNVATPSPAHTFTVVPTAPTPPGTTPRQGTVTISEIMFATDGGANEIQWIELSNTSKTETVALDAGTGWELIIENYDNPRANNEPLSGTINFKESGRVKTISPEQTVLIVSANGRNSGTTHAKGQLFEVTRVFKVYPALAAEFGMRTSRDAFLHPTQGFHIKLVDGRNNLVDEVGNLDGSVRTSDRPTWELPNGWTEDGDRTSIVRRYREYNPRTRRYTNKGIAFDGTLREAWIRAAETSFLDLSRKNIETWYGSRTDHGSPGVRAGGALPVQLSQFRPDLTETGTVVIHWTTESEVDNAGFNILRSQTRTGEFKVINAQLIPGAGTTAERNTYTWTDTTAKPNVVYYYQIEDVSLGGERQTLATVRLRGLVSATGKLTTQWGVLKRSRD